MLLHDDRTAQNNRSHRRIAVAGRFKYVQRLAGDYLLQMERLPIKACQLVAAHRRSSEVAHFASKSL